MAAHKRHGSLPIRFLTPGLVAPWCQTLQLFEPVHHDVKLAAVYPPGRRCNQYPASMQRGKNRAPGAYHNLEAPLLQLPPSPDFFRPGQPAVPQGHLRAKGVIKAGGDLRCQSNLGNENQHRSVSRQGLPAASIRRPRPSWCRSSAPNMRRAS